MRTIFNLYCTYRRCGASIFFATRRAIHVYRNGF